MNEQTLSFLCLAADGNYFFCVCFQWMRSSGEAIQAKRWAPVRGGVHCPSWLRKSCRQICTFLWICFEATWPHFEVQKIWNRVLCHGENRGFGHKWWYCYTWTEVCANNQEESFAFTWPRLHQNVSWLILSQKGHNCIHNATFLNERCIDGHTIISSLPCQRSIFIFRNTMRNWHQLLTKHWKVNRDNQTAWKPAEGNFLFLLYMNDDDVVPVGVGLHAALLFACPPQYLWLRFPPNTQRAKNRETQNWNNASKIRHLLSCSLVWTGQKCLLLRLHSPAVSAAVNKQQMMEDNVHQGSNTQQQGRC